MLFDQSGPQRPQTQTWPEPPGSPLLLVDQALPRLGRACEIPDCGPQSLVRCRAGSSRGRVGSEQTTLAGSRRAAGGQ